MSMNIKLSAKIKADLKNKNNEIIETREIFDNFSTKQTPTEITKKILNSDNKLQTYIEFVNERNYATDHINELYDFIDKHKGWELIWYEV